MDNPYNLNRLPTLQQALAHTRSVLGGLAHAPIHEAAWLLQHFVALENTAALIRAGSRVMTTLEFQHWSAALIRRQAGVPLAYLLGTAPFLGEMFQVREAVLIPRADSETLVHWVLQESLRQWQKDQQPLQILELGVGSGALLTMVGKILTTKLPTAAKRLIGIDRSAAAINVAADNLKWHQVEAQLIESDWCAALPGVAPAHSFSLIYSNPPYIAATDPALTQDGVCAEPKMALIAAEQGLADLATIIRQAPAWLREDGALAVEHGAEQGQDCRTLMQQRGYQHIHTLQDEGGRERVTAGTL